MTAATTVLTPAKLIEAYLRIRDKKKSIEAAHKKALEPFNDGLATIELELDKIMTATGLENLPSPDGTAYRSTKTSVTVADWDAFLNYVRANDAWHMLEHRASQTAVEELLESEKTLAPGVNMSRVQVVHVRKS